MTPGYKTTEFALIAFAAIAQLALALCKLMDAAWASMGLTALGIVYAVLRSTLKNKPR